MLPGSLPALLSGRLVFNRDWRKRARAVAWSGVLGLGLLGSWHSAVAKTATSISLAVSAASGPVTTATSGTVITLTATVQAGASTLTLGQVNFCDASVTYCTDIHLLGTAQLTSAGTAVLKFRPGPGTNSYKAVFLGTTTYASSSSTASGLTVASVATRTYSDTTSIWATGQPGNYSLTATVEGIGGSAAPTGNVSFLDTSFGNTSLATAPLGLATAGLGFLVSQTPGLANTPGSQITGDFNGDGIPDLAIFSYSGSYGSGPASVSIQFGNGDGTFTAGPTTSVGYTSSVILAGDFNGDGKTDLAILSSAAPGVSVITTILGNGDGTFGAPQISLVHEQVPSTGQTVPGAMVAADFNGDGKLDVAVAGEYVNPGGITILLGNGDGTFTAGPNLLPTTGSSLIATGDFNGDGIPDLIAVDYLGPNATVLLGKGDGTFLAVATPLAVGNYPDSLVTGDFRGDGILDLAVGFTSGSVLVLSGNGDGTFQPGLNSSICCAELIVAGDFNHDGMLDLAAVQTSSGTFTLLLNDGNGSFTHTVANPPSNQQISATSALLTADFNGDGVPDLALLSYPAGSSILLTELTQTAIATVSGIGPVAATTHNVEAKYPGDNNYLGSVSATTSLIAGVAPPVISPASGTFSSAQSITITDSTPGAAIYYNGVGTSGFVPYTGPIPLQGNGSVTIQAYASETGYDTSQTTSATYTLNYPAAATPVISLAPGWYPGTQTVTISDVSPDTVISYTTNGTTPFFYSGLYAGPITVSTSEIIVAGAAGPGYAASKLVSAQYEIGSLSSSFLYTFAGSGTQGESGDGGQATFAELNRPNSVAVDKAGNVYMTDSLDSVIRKVTASTGVISTIAGTGVAGTTGDNGPATSAELLQPQAIAVDASGDVFIAQAGENVIRRINGTTGTITTFAGNPTGSLGGTATGYSSTVAGLACDQSGNLYVAQNVNYYAGDVVEVNAETGTITKIAPQGNSNWFGTLGGIAVDSAQNVYVSDGPNSTVWQIDQGGNVTDFAGGLNAYGGDNGPAAQAELYNPQGVAVDGVGNVYIADSNEYAIREVDKKGNIHTVAGRSNYSPVVGSDGAPATSAVLPYLQSIAVDSAGDIYMADSQASSIQVVTAPAPPSGSATAQPVFSVAAGSYANPQTLTLSDPTPGTKIYITLDGTTPNVASPGYHGPIGITGNVTVQAMALAPGYLLSAPVTETYTITKPPPTIISTVAGTGVFGFSGAGGPATSAKLGWPAGVALDGGGNLYVADQFDCLVWRIAASTGNITVVAGTGTNGQDPDGSLATATRLSLPEGLAFDTSGNLYIAEAGNGRIRMVSALTGIITTVAGDPSAQTLGDGGPATSALLDSLQGLAFDPAGNLYVAQYRSGRVRRIDASSKIITTVAGPGPYTGPLGDGGLATSAQISPASIAFDSTGNLYIAGRTDDRIRRVDATTGIISTVAGNGIGGNSGDGGPATAAAINPASGIVLDSAGDIYFSGASNTVRRVDATTGIITTVAGVDYFGYSGDGGSATVAELDSPQGLALDAAGSLYIADEYNSVVRRVAGSVATPIFSLAAGTYTGTQTLTISGSASGAVFYYTTDGSTPTAGSNVYSSPISLSATETVKAIAIAPGYAPSAVATGAYTINQSVTPSITWPVPGSIDYGAALSGSQLNATASVPGGFVYSPALGTVLGAGTQTLSVTFTPTDVIDYRMTTASVTLTVKQATPSITWATPAPIVFGTALSSTQLDAVASVPGTFAYNPAAGSIPAMGSDMLAVAFTPTDATDYATANTSVALSVAQPSAVIGSLSPAIANAGGAAFTLTVNGSGYTSTSVVEWAATALSTQFVSGTQLTAQVPASLIASAGNVVVTVQSPTSGGGSNALQLEIDSAGSNTPPAFGVKAATVGRGSPAVYPVTLPATASNVSATCLNLPGGATCNYSATGGTLTIATSSTTPAGTYQVIVVFTESFPGSATAILLFPILVSPLMFLRKKRPARGFWLAACFGLLTVATVAATGCGGAGSSSTFTSSPTHQVASSGTVTIIVQ